METPLYSGIRGLGGPRWASLCGLCSVDTLDLTLWVLLCRYCGPHSLDSPLWTLLFRFHTVVFTLQILHCGPNWIPHCGPHWIPHCGPRSLDFTRSGLRPIHFAPNDLGAFCSLGHFAPVPVPILRCRMPHCRLFCLDSSV